LHEERRGEHRQHAEHGEQARHGGFRVATAHGNRDRTRFPHLRVNVFDFDGGFIDEDADGEGQAAERHEIDRLSGEPQRNERADQRQGNVEDHHQDAAPVAQE